MILGYKTYRDILGSHDKVHLGLHTYLVQGENGAIVLRVGSTIKSDLVTYRPDGSIVVNTNGMRSTNVREIINAHVPFFFIVDEGGAWLWAERRDSSDDTSATPRSAAPEFIALYTDGDAIHSDGRLDYLKGLDDAVEFLTLHAKIKKYAALAASSSVLAPSSYDCWGCYIIDNKGEYLDSTRDHILSHINNNDIVPSLLARAGVSLPLLPFAPRSAAQAHRKIVEKKIYEFLFEKIFDRIA